MTWNPTNANDVELIVSQVERDNSGSRTGATELANTARIVVDEFSIGTEEDLSGLSGVGNPRALGVSSGDVEDTFSFTVQGEDAELFKGLASDNGRAVELEIVVRLEDYRDKLTGARAGTRNLSGSSGDAVEFEVEGLATGRDPGDNT
ncbi:hypothetical protein [Natrinema sp. DC36]|uniref:hypothetical protein n=1 Tax=Natrinema sp. DC36 TaxID=2878680 RepID=UPI001CEFECB6|nr:hypothetical protein [Natrinema sp. DC36]